MLHTLDLLLHHTVEVHSSLGKNLITENKLATLSQERFPDTHMLSTLNFVTRDPTPALGQGTSRI